MHPKIKIKIKKTHNSRKEADKYKLCVQGTIVLQSQGYNSHSFLFFFPTPKKGCIRCCHNWKFIDIHFHCQSTHTAPTQPDFFQWGCWALLKPRTTPACLKEWGNQLQLGSVLQHSSWACAQYRCQKCTVYGKEAENCQCDKDIPEGKKKIKSGMWEGLSALEKHKTDSQQSPTSYHQPSVKWPLVSCASCQPTPKERSHMYQLLPAKPGITHGSSSHQHGWPVNFDSAVQFIVLSVDSYRISDVSEQTKLQILLSTISLFDASLLLILPRSQW